MAMSSSRMPPLPLSSSAGEAADGRTGGMGSVVLDSGFAAVGLGLLPRRGHLVEDHAPGVAGVLLCQLDAAVVPARRIPRRVAASDSTQAEQADPARPSPRATQAFGATGR